MNTSHTRLISLAGAVVLVVAVGSWYLGTRTAEAPAPVIVADEAQDALPDTAETATEGAPAETPSDTQTTPTPAPTPSAAKPAPTTVSKPVTTAPKIALVTYNGKAFSPNEISITKGDTVRFLNVSEDKMWIVSDLHPTHNTYPIKTDEGCSPTIFDMCKSVGNGKYWDFTFEREGTFGYHNEEKPVMNGKVEVNLRGEKPPTGGTF